MNLIGKIFTVLVAVLCLMLMCFAVMDYGMEKNWKTVVDNPKEPLGLSQKLTLARKENEQLNQANDRVNRDLAAVKIQDQNSLNTLENERVRLQKLDDANRQKIADMAEEIRKMVATLKAAHETLAKMREENDAFRADIDKAHADRDASFKQVVDLTDKLHNAVDERTQLKERLDELAAEHAKALECLRYEGFNYKTDYKAKSPPNNVEGVILTATSDNVVELSIGADDGLRKGHKMEVVRGREYVGRVEVTRTTPDRAVCRVIPEMLKTPMQRGDRAYARID